MLTRRDILDREQEIRQWVEKHLSKAEIARRLHCKHTTLSHYLNVMGITYNGNQSGKGVKHYISKQYVPFNKYIKECSVNSNRLRKKLIREGLKQAKCEHCGNDEWFGKPIPLEVHHKNGNRDDNELSNLEILCPNCHALTSNYRGKNIGKVNNGV